MITHFYHLYCDGFWGPILDEHISALSRFGLLAEIKEINIGIVGSKENQSDVIKFLQGNDIKFNIIALEESGFEQVTLKKLYKYSMLHEEDFYLYCHSKGSSICESGKECSSSDEARHRVAMREVVKGRFADCYEANSAWRKNMTKNLVVDWKRCVDLLNEGYQSVGCYLNHERMSGNFYWGNFWWAKGSLLASLEPPSQTSRYMAEKWLFSNYHKYQHRFKNVVSGDMFQLH